MLRGNPEQLSTIDGCKNSVMRETELQDAEILYLMQCTEH